MCFKEQCSCFQVRWAIKIYSWNLLATFVCDMSGSSKTKQRDKFTFSIATLNPYNRHEPLFLNSETHID